jgi:hypothetical protein
MTDSAIYEIVYPYCRGELLAFVTKAITGRLSFETFHAQLLGQFIPSRQLSQLRVERYERVQGEEEPLASYVQSIRYSALTLRIRETEAQVVERIVEALTPAQRACFIFKLLQRPLSNSSSWSLCTGISLMWIRRERGNRRRLPSAWLNHKRSIRI